jgi:hypothetical protein
VLGIEAPTAPKEEDSLWEDDVESGARPAVAPEKDPTVAPKAQPESAGAAESSDAPPPPVQDVSDLYDENY